MHADPADQHTALAHRIATFKSGKYTVERPMHLGAALAGRYDALRGSLSAIGLPLAGLVYVLPGLALVRREEWTRAEPVELAAVACAGSAAWWAVGFWFLGLLGIPLSDFALGSLDAAALVLVLLRRTAIAAAVAAFAAMRISRRTRSRNCRPTRSPRATTCSGFRATGPGTTRRAIFSG